MLTRRLLPILALFATLLAAPAAVAAPPGGECPPGQTDCWVYDEKPGKPGGGDGGGNNGGGRSKCYRAGEEVPCFDEVWGWLGSDGCYYKMAEPQLPSPDGSEGDWYTRTCLGGAAQNVWLTTPPGGLPDPEPIAQALAAVTLAEPDIHFKPDQGPGLVGLPVWLWVGQSPNTWGPVEASRSEGGLTVTINARVTGLTFKLGDGKSIECPTGGTPYPKGAKGPSPDCGYAYQKAGAYTITATTSWTVDWESNTGISGTITTERTDSGDIQIDELQVVTR
ncbi:hypothetical protein [Micromonospora sp. CPCC 206061]|uniref:hypothetical protein n=1 Tax=Micromonospora sp. CPCC 206061 TaxID=3122410 RepID=UPI002FF268D2